MSAPAAQRSERRYRRLVRAVEGNGDLLNNSASLMASSVLTSVLGFGYWWVAARLFPADAVGTASAAVSAMALVGTLGMFGMGTLLLSELPTMAGRRWNLITACLLVAATIAGLGGIGYAVVALVFGTGLRAAFGSPLAGVLLVSGMAVNAAALVLDEAFVGLLRGRLQLLRNAYFATGKLVMLGCLAALPLVGTGTEILATWIIGIPLSVALVALPRRATWRTRSIRPDLSLLRGLGRHAVDHNVLNLALFVPRASLPLVVAAVLSTKATAAFYAAWMVLTVLAMIPGHMATTLFTVASGTRSAPRGKIRMALQVSLGVGVPASVLVAVLARPIMATFGRDYADAAAGALAILALTFVATTMRQLFVAVSRIRGRTRPASLYAMLAGGVELVAAWYGASHGGLTHLAGYLAAVMVVEGLLMAPTVLRAAYGRPEPTGPPAARV
jgi:O-antigen/teichoic acid export membrane protein